MWWPSSSNAIRPTSVFAGGTAVAVDQWSYGRPWHDGVPGWPARRGVFEEETVMAAIEESPVDELPGTPVTVGEPSDEVTARSRSVRLGHLPVSELAFDRPAAPSPFGDDVEFPLLPEELRYTHTTTP
jgi:succinate dehydrogenase / fumarate reductase iron-sulfur subunit